jgi:small subunit ribosomal protein S16
VAVRIRLKRMGKVRTPFYRIVVCDSRTKRDGRVIEEIGTYNPKAEPSVIHVDSERAQHWLGVGAQPSTPVAAILKLTGDWQKHKGESVTPTLKVAEPRRDKTEIFNEALKESHKEPKSEAVTKKAAKSDKGTDKGADKGADKADKGTDSKADSEADSEADEVHASGSAEGADRAADENAGSGETADSGEQAKSED